MWCHFTSKLRNLHALRCHGSKFAKSNNLIHVLFKTKRVQLLYMFQALVCDGIFIHKSSCGQGTKAWAVIEPNIHKQLLRKIDLLLSMTEFGGKQMLHDRVIMEDHESHDNDDIRSSASSLDEDSRSSSGSTSSSDMVDDASSSTSYSSSSHSRGPLYELSELMAQLPIK